MWLPPCLNRVTITDRGRQLHEIGLFLEVASIGAEERVVDLVLTALLAVQESQQVGDDRRALPKQQQPHEQSLPVLPVLHIQANLCQLQSENGEVSSLEDVLGEDLVVLL